MKYLLPLFLFGCSAAGLPQEPATEEIDMGSATSKGLLAPCGVTFDPVPEYVEVVSRVAARWSAALDCDITVAPGGFPVRRATTKELTDEQGRVYDGVTTPEFIGLSDRWKDDTLALHEMGHRLGCHGHPRGTVVMREGFRPNALISAEDISCVQAGNDYPGFNPEK